MEKRKCKECAGEYDVDMFPNSSGTKFRKGDICFKCVWALEETKKWNNRFLDKAKRTLARKLRELKKQDRYKDLTRTLLIRDYGWDLRKVAHDIEHTFENWCAYCGYPFAEMTHGLHDLTIDIFDPNRAPVYSINTRWVCSTCNSIKSKMTPERWGRFTVYLKHHARQQEELRKNPWLPLPLFKDLEPQ